MSFDFSAAAQALLNRTWLETLKIFEGLGSDHLIFMEGGGGGGGRGKEDFLRKKIPGPNFPEKQVTRDLGKDCSPENKHF